MSGKNEFALKSISIGPARDGKEAQEGKAIYNVSFSLSWEGNDSDITIKVATGEGWDQAKLLACEKIKELGAWLAKAAEAEKEAPHITKYF